MQRRPNLALADKNGETALMKAKRNELTVLAQALEKIAEYWATTEDQPALGSNQTQHAANDH